MASHSYEVLQQYEHYKRGLGCHLDFIVHLLSFPEAHYTCIVRHGLIYLLSTTPLPACEAPTFETPSHLSASLILPCHATRSLSVSVTIHRRRGWSWTHTPTSWLIVCEP